MKAAFKIWVLLQLFVTQVSADDSLVSEPNDKIYNYVSHYEVLIKAPAEEVWPVLRDLSKWMYAFDLSPVSGDKGEEGEILRLYPEQDFLIQITKIVPNKLLVIANLPSTFRQELSTGVASISLQEMAGNSIVRIVMSRRYSWLGEGDNPMKEFRKSEEFALNSKALWQGRLLGKLKYLVENKSTIENEEQ